MSDEKIEALDSSKIENSTVVDEADVKWYPPSENKGKVLLSKSEAFRGPLPHPEHLAAYANIDLKLVDRIVTMAEKEQNHRHQSESLLIDMEFKITQSEITRATRGQVIASFILIMIICLGVYLIIIDKNIVGYLTLAAGVVIIMWQFFTNRSGKDIADAKSNDKSKSTDSENIEEE